MSDVKKRERRATSSMGSRTAVNPRDRDGARKSGKGNGGEKREPRREEGATREQIARRAHEIYLARGGGEGRDVEDWLDAEAELLEKKTSG